MSKASYTNNPNRPAKGRILYDINRISNDSARLASQDGIYFKFDSTSEKINTKYKMLIIGTEDSPYVGGFYMFDAQFPDQYPYFPMTVKTRTQGGKIRKHPNLYVSGKCCFSFLGTWAGPPWTACQNPETVGISMKSVLTNNPIINEPGWEKKNDARTKLYETMIRYFNIRYAVIQVLLDIENKKSKSPYPFADFEEAVKQNFIKYYDTYLLEVAKFEKYDGHTKKSPVYGFSVTFDCTYIKTQLEKLYNQIKGKYTAPVGIKKEVEVVEQINDTEVVNLPEVINTIKPKKKLSVILKTHNTKTALLIKKKVKKKTVRKAPKKSAKEFTEGFVSVGLDGNNWTVKQYISGSKRWVKKAVVGGITV